MELLSAIASTSINKSILETFEENQIFANQSSQSLQSVVKIINEKLSVSKERFEAINYLNLLISQCTLEIITENYNQWIFYVLKACETSSTTVIFNVLKKLLLVTKQCPDLRKQLLTQHLSKTIDIILRKDINCTENIFVLQCLEVVLFLFGGSCGQNKNAIEKYLLQYVDCDDNIKIELVARCLHLLQQVSGGSVQGINHKIQWQKQHEKLCGTLHLLLNKLYEPLEEIYSSSKQLEFIELSKMPDDSNIVKYLNSMTLRFCNVAHFLQNMLLTPFPTSKMVNVDAILNVISRGLSVCCSDISKNTNLDTLTLKTLISKIHTSLLEILMALIECLGTNLLPYSIQLCNYLLKELSWIEKSGYYIPCSNLKITIYKCMNKWIVVAKGSCLLHFFIKELTPLILRDIKTFKEEIAPKVTLQKNSKHSKKKNKISSSNNLHAISTQRNIAELNVRAEKITYWALKALQNIFQFIGCFIEPHFHKMLQEFVVAQLLEMQQKKSNYYESKQCCLELYRCLLITVLSPHPTLPPPVQYATHIFSVGQTDRHESISKLCADALLATDKILHPVCSTLNFPKDYYSDREFNKLIDANESQNENEIEQIEIDDKEDDDVINIDEDVIIIEENQTKHNNHINDVSIDKDLKTLKQLEELKDVDEIESDYEVNVSNSVETRKYKKKYVNSNQDKDLNTLKQLEELKDVDEIESDCEMSSEQKTVVSTNQKTTENNLKLNDNSSNSNESIIILNSQLNSLSQENDLICSEESDAVVLEQKNLHTSKNAIEINIDEYDDVGHRSKRLKIDLEIDDDEEKDMLLSFVNVPCDN